MHRVRRSESTYTGCRDKGQESYSPEGPLENLEARQALEEALKRSLPQTIPYIESRHHINDPEFVHEIMDCLDSLAGVNEMLR